MRGLSLPPLRFYVVSIRLAILTIRSTQKRGQCVGGWEHPITEWHPNQKYLIARWGVTEVTGVDHKVPSRHEHSHRMEACTCACSVVSDSLQPYGLQLTRLLLSVTFSRQKYWGGLPFPTPEDGRVKSVVGAKQTSKRISRSHLSLRVSCH